MESFAEIVDALAARLGGLTAVAAALKLPLTTLTSWRARNSIPSGYWSPLIALAQRSKVRGITFKRLSQLAAANAPAAGRRARARAA